MAGITFLNEARDPQSEVAPTPVEVFKRAFEAFSGELRVSIPGSIVRYDFKKQLADVRPDFKRRYSDGTVQDPPIIYNAPVMHPRAGDAIVHMPLAVGNKVTIFFSDRSLEQWLTSGKLHSPDDDRKHHISDAFVYPGGYPFSDVAKIANGEDLIIKNGNIDARIKKNGHVQVFNGSHELLKVLDEWISADLRGSHNWLNRVRTKLRTFVEK